MDYRYNFLYPFLVLYSKGDNNYYVNMGYLLSYPQIYTIYHMTNKEKTDLSKKELLLAGIRIFGTKGYDGTSVSDIENYLNQTRGAIIYHYKTKLGFFEATVNRYYFNRVLPTSVPEDYRNNLKGFIPKYVFMLEEECVSLTNNGIKNLAGSFINLETDAIRSISGFREKCASQNKLQLDVLEEVVRNAIASSEIKSHIMPVMIAEMFMNVVRGQLYRASIEDHSYYTDGLRRQFDSLYRLISFY